MKRTSEEKERELKKLQDWIKPDQKVWTKVTHIAQSGMSRSIEPYIVVGRDIINITYSVSVVLDLSIDQRHGGVRLSGCGMDMGYDLVDRLRYVMYGTHGKLHQRWI